jgi:hypothetical protein
MLARAPGVPLDAQACPNLLIEHPNDPKTGRIFGAMR